MRDRFGRKIDYMRISITDRCNLRCRYCMPEGIEQAPMKELLTYEEIVRVCRGAVRAGICKLKITGGEPLVRPGCPQLVKELKSITGIKQVTMTTNGILLKKFLPELLKNGLDAVNISLDTMDRDTYRQITGKDGLLQAADGIREAIESGIRVKVNVVLQKGINEAEWKGLAELTRRNPLDVRFIEMMPIGDGKGYETIYNEEVLAKLKALEPGLCEDISKHGNGPSVYYRIPGAKGSIGFISAMHGKFCGNCNRIRLTSTGRLKPCLCFGDSLDVRKVLRGTEQENVDELLYQAVREAISMKPAHHKFEVSGDITECKKMVQIGG